MEVGAATALVGVGCFQIHNVYTAHAGELSEVRQASGSDLQAAQQLRDADALAGGITLLVGGSVSFATGKWYPLGLSVAAFLLVSGYYHKALAQPAVTTPAVIDAAYNMTESAYVYGT